MENIRLAIIEDDPVIKESLESYLGAHPSLELQISEKSVEQFLHKIRKQPNLSINMLLLDIGLPGMSGIEGIPLIKKYFPDLDILMLTTFEESEMVFAALCAGACSYISKRTPLAKIQEAIFMVQKGGSYMSPSIARKVVKHFVPKPKANKANLSARQQEIVQGLVDGLTYKMIAQKLYISIDTVRDHIKKIYKTLEVNSKAEVIRKSLEDDL